MATNARTSAKVLWIVTMNDARDPSSSGTSAGSYWNEGDALRFALQLAHTHLPRSGGEIRYEVVPITPADVGRRLWDALAQRAL